MIHLTFFDFLTQCDTDSLSFYEFIFSTDTLKNYDLLDTPDALSIFEILNKSDTLQHCDFLRKYDTLKNLEILFFLDNSNASNLPLRITDITPNLDY